MSLNIMGKKKGMTRIFNEKGESIVCTVIKAEPNVVVQIKNNEVDGYNAVQMGFELNKSMSVTLSVYNVFGQRVTTLVDNWRSAGMHKVLWNPTVASGWYQVQLETRYGTVAQSLIIVR